MKPPIHKLFAFALTLALIISFLPVHAQPAYAVSSDIVISQVYGGGGNSGGIYTNDFIELFNLGTTTVSLAGWSVQYTSATGTGNFGSATNLITPLSGPLLPGQYLLIQEAAGANVFLPLPTPDVTDLTPINMSATGGKVALVNTTTPLGCNGSSTTCSSTALAAIVDLVGWDGANFYETTGIAGTGPAPATSNATAALRNGNGSVDTDNNAADFSVGAPNPRNSLYPFAASGLAAPATIVPGQTTLLKVTVTPGTNPASTGIGVACNLSPIGGSPAQAFYDDGSNGDQVAGDNAFSFGITVASPGTMNLACTFSDAEGRSGTTTISLTVLSIVPIGTVNGVVTDTEDATQHNSPKLGQIVAVQGVIYEKTLAATSTGGTYYAFFIQNTAATRDADPNTSDGLYVFMNTTSTMSAPGGSYTPTVGDEVAVQGTVTEFFNMTELTNPSLLTSVLRSNVDLDAELAPFAANPPANLADANRYWERRQGMRGQVPADSIVLNGRNVFNPADAEIWVARADSTIAARADPYERRAFRDAHPLDDNYNAGNWDGNGYRILMGSLGIKATAGDAQALLEPARTFDFVTNAPVGGVNYSFSKYRIEVTTQPDLGEGPDPAANNPPGTFDRSISYSIVDYNLENLYDYRDNPFSGCDFTGNSGCPRVAPYLAAITPPYDYVPASDGAYQARLTDIARQIINDLHGPDILMVQEVENQDICMVTGTALTCGSSDNLDGKPDVLQELALKVADLGGPTYDAAFDRNSSDLRGIAPAFLYRTDRVQLLPPAGDPLLGGSPAIVYPGAAVPYDGDVSNPKTLNAVLPAGITACETSWVFPRAPDIALFRIYSTSIGVGSHRDVYVVDNHFKSGPDTCVGHRTEQARYNAAIVQFLQAANPNARIVLGGDLNVYPRPDDPFAPIGQPASSDQLGPLYDPGLGLTNLWDVLLGQAPESAYSYVFVGMAQTLDQVFVNPVMLADLKQFRTAHINSDFPADYPGDVARGTSDHDPDVASFVINDPPTVAAGGPYSVNEGSSVTLTATGTDPEGGPLTYAWDLDDDGTFETPGQSVTFGGMDGPATLAVKVQVTDNVGLSAVASALVDVLNVPPTAALSNDGPVLEGIPVTVSFSNQFDPSAADTAAGFHYAFACDGSSLSTAIYATSSSTASADCVFNDGPSIHSVRARIIDKDDGYNEYTTSVTVNAARTLYLHGSGGTANPPVLFLDNTASTAVTEKYKDSAGINFNGGNPWKDIGTWSASPGFAPGTLLSLNNLHVWLGLKNTDDQGTNFDLRVEMYKNGTQVASSETYCITNVTRNPALAKEVTASFALFSPVPFNGPTDVLSLKVRTRIGTNGSGGFCGGHSNAVGLRLYFDAVNRLARFAATFGP
jgi:hypothetical protein